MIDCLIYALGGGLGHLQRALALARAARKRGLSSEILSNSPWFDRLPPDSPWRTGITIRNLPPDGSAGETANRVRNHLRERTRSCLIIDTFPRGLAGELPDLLSAHRGRKIFVHRDMSAEYWIRYDCARTVSEYDLVLLPGEGGPLLDNSIPRLRTDPWLLLDAGELAGRAAARARLGIPDDSQPLIVIAQAGKAGEGRDLLARASVGALDGLPVHWKGLGPEAPAQGPLVWPLLEWLNGVDLVVGGGGYHTVYECRATGTPLLGIPWPRLYDRQSERLTAGERVPDAAELPSRLKTWLSSQAAKPGHPASERADYTNGTHAAVEALLGLC